MSEQDIKYICDNWEECDNEDCPHHGRHIPKQYSGEEFCNESVDQCRCANNNIVTCIPAPDEPEQTEDYQASFELFKHWADRQGWFLCYSRKTSTLADSDTYHVFTTQLGKVRIRTLGKYITRVE